MLAACGGSTNAGPVRAADAFFAAAAARNAAGVCSHTTAAVHAHWQARWGKSTCVAALDDLFSRDGHAKALKTNFSHASARLVDQHDGRALVDVLGDPGAPRHYQLQLTETAHGWLVGRAEYGH
jgi:hypothetical protein